MTDSRRWISAAAAAVLVAGCGDLIVTREIGIDDGPLGATGGGGGAGGDGTNGGSAGGGGDRARLGEACGSVLPCALGLLCESDICVASCVLPQDCNPSPLISALYGDCVEGKCQCHDGYGLDPVTAKCWLEPDDLVVGDLCFSDDDCGSGYTCFDEDQGAARVPDGYCLFAGDASAFGVAACQSDDECPEGTLCSPLPWAMIPGVCMRACESNADCRPGYDCDLGELFPGEPDTPASSGEVCWTIDPVCEYGADQSCNDGLDGSGIYGTCNPDGTCTCDTGLGAELNPETGRCTFTCPQLSDECPPQADLGPGAYCRDDDLYQCALACWVACGCDEEEVFSMACPYGCVDPLDGNAGCAVCELGADQTCNDDLELSSILGICNADRTCTCIEPAAINPATGRCAF